MMPERIGTIGSTQGVNASSRPAPKNVASTASRLPLRILSASRSCSERIGAAAGVSAVAEGGDAPSATVIRFVVGG